MMRTHGTVALLALSSWGCGDDDAGAVGRAREPEISVVVTEGHVEVHAHQPGSCREVTEMPATEGCETFGWAVLGVETASATDLCRPEPTCVSEVRLERAGEVVASASGHSVGFFTSLRGTDERVVIEGCGEPIAIDLPPPLAAEVEPTVSADSGVIRVATSGASGGGVLARAEGLISYPRSFRSACRSDSGSVDLPTSPDFDSYLVQSLVLAEPIIFEDGLVQVFTARENEQVVSQSARLGPVWDAAVAVAASSPRYDTCESYCSAWQQECQRSADPDECTVLCVAQGSLKPSCAEQWDSYIGCQQAALACDDVLVVRYSESPFETTESDSAPSCAAESAAYSACVGAAE